MVGQLQHSTVAFGGIKGIKQPHEAVENQMDLLPLPGCVRVSGDCILRARLDAGLAGLSLFI